MTLARKGLGARRGLDGVAIAALLAMLAIYYGRGLVLLFWPDSLGYLVQALGLAGEAQFARPGDRSIGYPALVALALETPWPALAVVVLQAVLVAAAFIATGAMLISVVIPRLGVAGEQGALPRAAVRAGIALATLYSVVHVQIASLLTEALFCVLALTGVLAVTWLVLPRRKARRPWLEAPMAAAVGALAWTVKPHWQLAAIFLALVAGHWLWRSQAAPSQSRLRSMLGLGAALALTVAAAIAVSVPDRVLGARFSPREQALFGARTAFCNHAHLIEQTLVKRQGLTLQDDARFESEFRARLDQLIAERGSGWRLLGFNGDLCVYDQRLSTLLDARFADPKAQGQFLLASLARAALHNPLPFANKVMVQIAQGFLSAFARFAIHAHPGLEPFQSAGNEVHVRSDFLRGIALAAETGPLGSKERLDGTVVGHAVQGLLAVTFTVFDAALIGLALASLALPWWRWTAWSAAERQSLLVFVALPLAAILAHHVLIALVHTFDIWRYGFNAFFVNLYFIGTSALFWLEDWRRWRSERRTSITAT